MVAQSRPGTLRRQEAIQGLLLVSPWIAGLVIFIVGPVLASLYLSFTDYNVLRPPRFVGIQNYVTAFTADQLFPIAINRTVTYVILVVPTVILGSLGLALLLNRGVPGTSLFRTVFFMPSLVPVVASAILWVWIFQPQVGLLNYLLRLIGIQGPAWLGSSSTALPSLVLVTFWGSVGGTTMIIFLAGLQGVPAELYDAAAIDGAGNWRKFWHVTLPMLSPTMLFNVVLGIIGAFQVFSIAYVATNGGPAYATWFYVYYLFQQGFNFYHMGYAAAMAWIFLVLVLAFTYLQVRWSQHWVYYEGGERNE
ncbi:MAG TPA: sugar ABC transporter permease [Chloroflexota bacterium]|nr:sugar ABC transporter permease [Chloroflexota bacterium]